jgi:formylglycine-generating enzyme required for sulfatase activity
MSRFLVALGLLPFISAVSAVPKRNDVNPKPGEERDFDVGNGVKMRFCWVPGSNGKFKIGSPKAEQDYLVKTFFEGKRPEWLDYENEYEVAGVDGFWMATYKMTQSQYIKLTGKENPSYFSADGGGKDKVKGLNTDDFPVERVSWDDAQECIKQMKVPSRLKRACLPSEVQWEWAARRGRGNERAFYWGDELNGDKANCDGSVFPYGMTTKGNNLGRTSKVGSYEREAPHVFGLCDMVGNVYEWCEDYYGSYEKLPAGRNPVQTVRQTSKRSLRGGSWNMYPLDCRSASRTYNEPDTPENFIGFRVVLLPD